MKPTKTFHKFDSCRAMAAAIVASVPRPSWAENFEDKRKDSAKKSDRDWYGRSFDEAVELLSNGSAEMAARIKAAGVFETRGLGNPRTTLENSVVGCIPSVPNYLHGVPKQMLRINRTRQAVPIITINVFWSIGCTIDAEKANKAALDIANMIAGVERSGVRVNLNLLMGSKDRDKKQYFATLCNLKKSDAPLNLMNIAYPLTDISIYRVLYLTWLESVSDYMPGYGRIVDKKELLEQIEVEGFTFEIRSLIEGGTTIESLTAEINEYIKRGGK